MSDPQLTFLYEPTSQDLIAGRPNANGFRSLGPYLAVMPPSSYLVHGNSEITIVDQKKQNVASKYATFRRWRQWTLAPGEGYIPTGPVYNWDLDTTGNGPSWKDIPGAKLGNPAEWPQERELLEFFVLVDGHPEMGSLYFFVVVSLKPGQYRVEMSSALHGNDGDPTVPLKNTPVPWAQESGCPIKVNSGWLSVPQLPQRKR
ncbi:MAG TPA: hypothetical protein VKV39_02070 [Candidatus Sulfotelmatobacter sp.]|nr:hypothetical protein [Candidatus Sulfotelmatobacter sp.]